MKQMSSRPRRLGGSDRGSIMPLAIGFMTVALALVIIAVIITDVYMAHRRLFALADSAALAAADSYTPGLTESPSLFFADADVTRAAERYMSKSLEDDKWSRMRVRASASDANHISVELTGGYRPVLISAFVPKGIELHAAVTVEGALLDPQR